MHEEKRVNVEFPRPVETIEPLRLASPLVFSSPHSGSIYPERFLAESRLDPLTLRRSEDAFVDELFLPCVGLGAPLLRALFPRAYLDVNREPFELDPQIFDGPMPDFANTRSLRVAVGLGTIPRVVGDAQPIYRRTLPLAEGLRRIETLYRPYHSRLNGPRFDSYGRLAGAELLTLTQLGRPRVDVVITLSGIFRDLMPLQVKLLAEAAFMAAGADEPIEQNFIRKHALAFMAEHGGDLETASLRVFGNAEGAYGSNVNSLVDNSRWDDGDELAETYTRRKGFAYGRSGRPMQQPALLKSVLAGVELAYQNLDSVELGVTTVDTYFDTLGGISRAIKRAKGADAEVAPVYIGDQTRDSSGGGTVRTLTEQVALETRTRMLNPKWYEGMLKHGYEGVRQIEVHVTNTMGWSATTGQVQPWVYEQLTETFVLDPAMRERLSKLNPTASAKVANRLIEASERKFWKPDPQVLEALRRAGEELEDRLEGIYEGVPA